MNQRSLQEIVTDAVSRARTEGNPANEDALLHQVLADPDMRIIMDGYRMHDRAEGLEDVMERDIRRMIADAVREEGSNSAGT